MNATARVTAFSTRSVTSRTPVFSRNATIALAVIGLHILLIWALQSGLMRRAAEIIVPVQILAEFLPPPALLAKPIIPEAPPPAPVVPKKQAARSPVKAHPQPLASKDPTPSPNAPIGVITPVEVTTPAPVAITPPAPSASVLTAPAPSATANSPGPPAVQLPSSDAEYLQNPRPPYPPMSKRLNEQGRTVIKVLIGIDGLPQRAEISRSSGYDRLDQAASATVMRWRFVAGKRNGMPEAMWFNVPINWVLE